MCLYIYTNTKDTDKWNNKTKLTGDYTDENGNITELEDNDEHTTTNYEKVLKIITLPRTGSNLDMLTIVIRSLSVIITYGIVLVSIRMLDK